MQKVNIRNLFQIDDISAPHRAYDIVLPEFYKLVELPEQTLTLKYVP